MLDTTLSLTLLTILASVLYWIKDTWFKHDGSLSHLPGPRGLPFLGNSLQVKMASARIQFSEWSKAYGPLYRIKLLTGDAVVISSYEAQTEALLGNNLAAAGRNHFFRQDLFSEQSGIVFNTGPSAKWALMRKLAQRHIKQFGDGVNRIEQVIFDLSQDMFDHFRESAERGEQIDPKIDINACALRIIIYMIIGQPVTEEDRIFQLLKDLEPTVWPAITMGAPEFVPMDILPVLFHLPTRGKRKLQKMMKLKEDCMEEILLYADNDDNLLQSLLDKAVDEVKSTDDITRREAALTSVNMVLAGHSTTTCCFTFLVHLLAQRPDVQEQIHAEIQRHVPPEAEHVSLNYRPVMHYCRAVLFEMFRYYPVASLVPRLLGQDITVAGHRLPKGTTIILNQWFLHRDEAFWKDPEVFAPERFLNKDGTLVDADHPNRAHLRPFSAGMRTCVGQLLAQARLFIWTTNIVRRFKVRPGDGCTKEALDPRKFVDAFILLPSDCKVRFTVRE